MTDQIQVTDDTAKKIHAWCDEKTSHVAMDATESDIVRYLRATIPKPPTILADEIRDTPRWWRDGAPTWEQCCARFEALADRAEILEKQLEDSEGARAGLGGQVNRFCKDLKRVTGERGEARAELDKLKFETLEGLTAVGWMRARKAAEQEMERLTREVEWWNSTGISGAVTATTTVREEHRDD